MLKKIWFGWGIHSKLIILCLFSLIPYWLFMSLYLLPLVEANKVQDRKQGLVNVLDIVSSELAILQERQAAGQLTQDEAQAEFKAVVNKYRYSKNEYIWVHDLAGIMQMHPINEKLNNQNLLGLKDPNGVPLFSNMNELVKKQGEGTVEYMWPKPGSDKPQPKLSYVRLDPKWNWVIGTGVYIDDIKQDLAALSQRIYLFYAVISLAALGLFYLLSSSLVRKIDQLSLDVAATSMQIGEVSESIAKSGQAVRLNTEKSSENIESSLQSLKTLREISENNRSESHNVVKLTEESEHAARSGYEKLKELNQAVQDLATTNEKVIQSMNVIDDIAFQTNLLALNAAVEAARAGESGRGFAVVADAVRSLAQKSSEAAKEVRLVTEESKLKTEKSVQMAEEGMNDLKDISESFVKVVAINHKIAQSSDEQNEGVAKIEADILNVSSTMSNFAESAHHTAVDSYELSAYSLAVINQLDKMSLELIGSTNKEG